MNDALIGHVLYKGMSRDISLRRLGADPFLSRHSAQLVERALSLREWSCSGLRSCFLSVCETEERFLFVVVPCPCCGGAIRFLKPSSLTVIHSMSGNAWSYWRLVVYGFLRLSEEA
jgi:hypothetical protein